MRKVFDTISDFAANAGIVTGGRPVRLNDVDLRWVQAHCCKERRDRGDRPAARRAQPPGDGVAWLANKIAPYDEQPEGPRDIVLAGSFTRPVAAQGDRFRRRPRGARVGGVPSGPPGGRAARHPDRKPNGFSSFPPKRLKSATLRVTTVNLAGPGRRGTIASS